jgi:hypothetical protein
MTEEVAMYRASFMRLVLAVLLGGGFGVTANAAIEVTLSSPQDLAHLTVGEQVTVDVNLQGLPVGSDFIFNLNTSVLFPSNLLQTVPDTTNTSGLTAGFGSGFAFQFANQPPNFYALSSLTAGSATGIFNDQSPSPSEAINENGLYYSFILKAIAPGSGTIAGNTAPGSNQYAADSTGFNFAPLPPIAPLPFTIAATAVPEPSSLVLCAMASLAGLGWTWSRRRRSGPRRAGPALEHEALQ